MGRYIEVITSRFVASMSLHHTSLHPMLLHLVSLHHTLNIYQIQYNINIFHKNPTSLKTFHIDYEIMQVHDIKYQNVCYMVQDGGIFSLLGHFQQCLQIQFFFEV